jgi:type IV secretion system protein VirB4
MHFGYCTPTLLVWGDTEEELAYREREATKVLQDEGLIVAQDTVNACQAWLGSLDMVHNVRAPLIPSLGLAGLLPHATIWAGEERDAHLEGPPLFLASSDGVPFRFVLHPRQSELGHTMILGPSRTGKSAILGLMMSQFWRYHDAQIFCFDKDEQLYTTTLLHGGVHYDCHGVSVQPLGRIDAVGEQRWALGWLMQVIRSRGVALTPEDEEQLWVALERLAGFPRPLRTLSGYAACLQVQRLKRALQPFLMGGPYAFFDADHDAIQWQDWTTIEMRALQGMPDALPHALRYFFHGIEQRLTGRPTLIVLDEVRKLAADPVFGLELLDWIKERAKVNVSVVMSSQDFADLSKTVIWEALQNNTQTWVFLPNPEAVNAVMAPLYASIGLSAAQREFLALSTPKQDYLYKSGRSARRFQMVLTPLERALVAASTPEEIAAMRALRQEPLKEPLVSAWLRTQGFGNEADIYRTHYDKEYADAAHL